MKKKIKKYIILGIILISVLGSGYYFIGTRQNKLAYTTVSAKRGDIIQTVNETGAVKSENELNLSFQSPGKINRINSTVGGRIKKGEILAELDTAGLEINRREAEAALRLAETNLAKLLAGATSEDRAVALANLSQARIAYQSARNELDKIKKTAAESIAQAEKTLYDLEAKNPSDVTTYEQAVAAAETNLGNIKATYQKAIDNSRQSALTVISEKQAIAENALTVIDRTINDENAKDLISVKNPEHLVKTKADYEASLTLLNQTVVGLAVARTSASDSDTESVLTAALAAQNKVFSALQNCYSALEASITSATKLTPAQLDAFRASIVVQQTYAAAAVSAVESAKQNFSGSLLNYKTNVLAAEENSAQARAAYENAKLAAKNNLSSLRLSAEQQITSAEGRVFAAQEAMRVAEAQYNKIIAAADKYDIMLSQTKVYQAQAAVDLIKQQMGNSLIISLIDGVVTKINFKEGEQAAAGAPAVSVLGSNNFTIEVLVSEADIAKIRNNQAAEITLDAFGDDIKFKGEVVFIEPAETVIQGVIYYKVKVNFEGEDKEIKSGMTANITIITARKSDVLLVPSRGVIIKNGQGRIVRVLSGGQMAERPISVGLAGDDGMVEVLDGVNEGEAVVTFINSK